LHQHLKNLLEKYLFFYTINMCMSSKGTIVQESIPYQALVDENSALKDKIESLRVRLKDAEERERSLNEAQEISHIGNWCRNIETGEVHWSDEVYRIFGFEPQEIGITYDKFLSRVHPDEREYLIEAVKQALNQKFFDAEYRIIRPDGEERIMHEDIKVICNNENVPIRLSGTVQDITERKKTKALI
jgi:PAS domain S-box-containing protein